MTWHAPCILQATDDKKCRLGEDEEGRDMYAEENGTIMTRSPIVAMYLAKVRGLELRTVVSRPMLMLMGCIVYSRCWLFVSAA